MNVIRTFKSISVLLLIIISLISVSSYADTQTVLNIKKITTVTGPDAEHFKELFGERLSLSHPELSIQCGKKSCEITTSRAGFSGDLAKQLLNGRKDVVFLSENHKFKVQCGEAGVPFCNITQEDAVLK